MRLLHPQFYGERLFSVYNETMSETASRGLPPHTSLIPVRSISNMVRASLLMGSQFPQHAIGLLIQPQYLGFPIGSGNADQLRGIL